MKRKRVFRIKIRIRDCNIIFKEELGPGVIGSKDIEYIVTDKEVESPLFGLEIIHQKEALLNEVAYAELEEIT